MGMMQASLVAILSVAFAIGATIALAAVADRAQWCCVHGWALAHATGLIVLMLFGLVGYHLIRAIGTRLGWLALPARSSWLPHVAYVSAALGTFVETEFFMWLGLIAGGAAV